MSRGTFTLIPSSAYDAAVPMAFATKWDLKKPDESGEPAFFHPTWREAIDMDLSQKYGVVRPVTYDGASYMLIEFSLAGGLTDDLTALQETDPAVADYQILTVTEARALLEGQDIFRT